MISAWFFETVYILLLFIQIAIAVLGAHMKEGYFQNSSSIYFADYVKNKSYWHSSSFISSLRYRTNLHVSDYSFILYMYVK